MSGIVIQPRPKSKKGTAAMGLKIIGSGFGRTGTMSTKTALEQLGFGPCHHMVEVMRDAAQPAHWAALAAGAKVDWAAVFSGYRSQVDFPGAAFWHELSLAFPEAKVIHTERPEDEWWASYSGTIGKFFALRETIPLPPPIAAIFETMDKLLIKDVFGGFDRETSIKAYQRNNAKVRAFIPPERLLIFSPADGWDPLCRFLGVPVPATAFPRSNARDEFWAHFGGEPAGTPA
ncbi:sulfotransferase family protein [Falsiroseomonas sp.]|uniref:sulfotransferase family protein n=1 Tax=Falsiroseomonas sp. TaxID=2870721 RepID=UPI003567869F